jgi:hypothetical protein
MVARFAHNFLFGSFCIQLESNFSTVSIISALVFNSLVALDEITVAELDFVICAVL